jgi:hypothetical protein
MRYIAIIAAWKSASLAWIQHNQSINQSIFPIPSVIRHLVVTLRCTRIRSAVTVFWAPQQLGATELRTMEKRCGVSREQGEAWLFLVDVSWPRRCTAGTFPAIGSSVRYPAEYLESKPPLRPIYGGKWNTTVFRCRQRRPSGRPSE